MNGPWSRMVVVVLALAFTAVNADDELPVLDRLRIGVGAFSNQLDLNGRFDGSVVYDGSSRDFDHELGFDNRRLIELLSLSWRPFEGHQFDLLRYRDTRNRDVALNDTLRFRGQTFPVQAELHGEARFVATELVYTWWHWRSSDYAIGPQFGVLRLETGLSLRGQVASDDFGNAEGSASVDEQVLAPLVGLAGHWRVAARWRAKAELRLVRLQINAIEGDAFSGKLGLSWFPSEHLGITLQYADARLRAERSRDDITGRLEVGFRGPQVLLELRY